MKTLSNLAAPVSLAACALASCAAAETGESQPVEASASAGDAAFTVTEMGTFDEPWAIEFVPGTAMLAITEKAGTLKLMDTASGQIATVTGAPEVEYKGQGGLGDVLFLDSEAGSPLDGRTIYLSWAEAGEGDTAGAAVGRGTLACPALDDCSISDLSVIWRQSPKVTGRGHYSHRMHVSPDGRYLFVASGDRQKQTPAQDTSNTLGSIVRLNLDGTPAAGNPLADKAGASPEIWSYGHRNILGLDFDEQGRLWDLEHGPAGGDELNLVQRAANYGWPERSYGDNYNGVEIADHSADDGFVKPAIHWNPVIAPGDMIFYTGDMFGPWKGQALIPGLATNALVRVAIEGESAREVARHDFGKRLRSIAQGPDGAIWIAENGEDGRVLKLTM